MIGLVLLPTKCFSPAQTAAANQPFCEWRLCYGQRQDTGWISANRSCIVLPNINGSKNLEGVAVVLKEVPLRPGRKIKGFSPDEWILGLFFGDTNWQAELADKHPEITWFGESIQTTGSRGKPKRKLIQPGKDIMEAWSTARKSMIITSEKAMVPNVIYLDAEERR